MRKENFSPGGLFFLKKTGEKRRKISFYVEHNILNKILCMNKISFDIDYFNGGR
jgi:hypothetical protein